MQKKGNKSDSFGGYNASMKKIGLMAHQNTKNRTDAEIARGTRN
jgi:hypothetical protein